VDLAAVFGQAAQPGLLKADMLSDHLEKKLDLGSGGHSCLDQTLQLSIWWIW
jgi:hypothetical protein